MSEYIDKFEFIKAYCDASKIDENGELPLAARLDIRHALPFVKGDASSSNTLWKLLEIKCAEMTSLIWTRSFPHDRTPLELLQKAERIARGGSEKAERTEMDNVKTLLDNKLSLGEQFFPASYAGFACWAAARSVYFGAFDYGPVASEKDLDPDQWDACFFASLAYCGGAVWEEGIGDKTKRREFWTWYLKQAIPSLLPQ